MKKFLCLLLAISSFNIISAVDISQKFQFDDKNGYITWAGEYNSLSDFNNTVNDWKDDISTNVSDNLTLISEKKWALDDVKYFVDRFKLVDVAPNSSIAVIKYHTSGTEIKAVLYMISIDAHKHWIWTAFSFDCSNALKFNRLLRK